jgi:hypothetical protein
MNLDLEKAGINELHKEIIPAFSKSRVDSGMFVRTKKEFLENFKRKEE